MRHPAEPLVPRFATYGHHKHIKAIWYDDEGNRVRYRTGTADKFEAYRLTMKKMEGIEPHRPTEYTLKAAMDKAFVDEWNVYKDVQKRAQQSKMLVSYFGAKTKLSRITEFEINGFIEHLRHDLENSNATINRKLALLKRLLNIAHKQWRAIERVPYMTTYKEKRGGHRRAVTPDELSVILKHCDEKHSVLFRLLNGTGLRPSEAINSQWSDYDLDTGVLRLDDTKNGESWVTPLFDAELAMLRAWRKVSPSCPFPETSISTIRLRWNKGRAELGLLDDKRFTPYSLRHSFAKRMLAKGWSTAQVKDWMHHKTILTTECYIRHDCNELLALRDRSQ